MSLVWFAVFAAVAGIGLVVQVRAARAEDKRLFLRGAVVVGASVVPFVLAVLSR